MIVGNPIITGAEYREYYTGDYSIDLTSAVVSDTDDEYQSYESRLVYPYDL